MPLLLTVGINLLTNFEHERELAPLALPLSLMPKRSKVKSVKPKTADDPYWPVVRQQYQNVLYLYRQFTEKHPVMLFDIQEQRVYAYPCDGFAASCPKSRAGL